MKKIILDRWKANEAAQAVWAEFIHSKEFDEGMRVLELHAGAVLYPGESEKTIAHRHAFQSGFLAALEMVARLPEIGTQTPQEILKEWEHLYNDEQLDE